MKESALRQPDWKRRVSALNLEPPWKSCRFAEEFVVEPVSEAAERLSEQQARHERISK